MLSRCNFSSRLVLVYFLVSILFPEALHGMILHLAPFQCGFRVEFCLGLKRKSFLSMLDFIRVTTEKSNFSRLKTLKSFEKGFAASLIYI